MLNLTNVLKIKKRNYTGGNYDFGHSCKIENVRCELADLIHTYIHFTFCKSKIQRT